MDTILVRKILLILFLSTLFSFNSAFAQRDNAYDSALVPFMNYIRDDVLHIGDWANGEEMELEINQGYIPSRFKRELKNYSFPEFSNAESDTILKALLENGHYELSCEMLNKSKKNPKDSLSALFHQLYVDQFRVNRGIQNRFSISYYQAQKINIDSLKILTNALKPIVKSYTELYNATVAHLNDKIWRASYYFTFHPPIFLRNYSYCILEYCDVPKFDFHIVSFRKVNGRWQLVRELCQYDSIVVQ